MEQLPKGKKGASLLGIAGKPRQGALAAASDEGESPAAAFIPSEEEPDYGDNSEDSGPEGSPHLAADELDSQGNAQGELPDATDRTHSDTDSARPGSPEARTKVQ
eukprot:15536751-Heterocapsa_arctica.AAC.1